MTTFTKSQKIRNLKRDPRVTLLLEDGTVYAELRGVIFHGTVELEEDVDVVGISILSGAHMRLIPRLAKALEERGIADDLLLMVGGTIPEDDVEPLQKMGVQGVFPVGSFTSAMTDFITENISRGRSAPQV